MPATANKMRVVVLISGRGSNLRSILSATESGQLPIDIAAVISNKEQAQGLDYAQAHDIPTHTLDHKEFPDRLSFDQALIQLIDQHKPQLIVLAGFMRILTDDFVHHYLGKLINIHPSLLPAYPGLNTHQQAIEDQAQEHGASVHFVTPELDGGPVIAQIKVPVLEQDSAEQLAQRVLEGEHLLYPQVIAWFADNRLRMHDSATITLDGKVITQPIVVTEDITDTHARPD